MSNNKSEKSIFQLGLILLIITAVAGVLLGFVHEITKEPIAIQQKKANKIALSKVLPTANDFELVKDLDFSGYKIIREVYKTTNNVGYVFKVYPRGYGGEIELVVGINNKSKISGIEILKHSETPGLGAKAKNDEFKDRFKNKNAKEKLNLTKGSNNGNDINAITGATITSTAVVKGVNTVIEFYNNKFISKEGQ